MLPPSCRTLGRAVTRRVSMGNDVDLSLHVECLLYRQTMPIARWLTTLKKMNTRYVHNGSRMHTDRWLSLDAAGARSFSL